MAPAHAVRRFVAAHRHRNHPRSEAARIRVPRSGTKVFHHPKLGTRAYEHSSYQSNDDPSLRLVVLVPTGSRSTASSLTR